MPVLQLTVETRDPEGIEAACFEAGATSVTLLDAADSPILEPAPGTTPLWPTVRVVAHFAPQADRNAIGTCLDAASPGASAAARFEVIADRAWEREWLKDFRPMRFGARLWVCPQGQAPDDPRAVVIDLDPGLAFGTGTHETTALCLTWLECTELFGLEVIDYGCGSGILAIAALKLGAHSAIGVDLDPQALIATRDNAARNGVEVEALLPEAALPPCDLLLANILAEPLIALAPRFASLVRPRGGVLLSGILGSQADAVASAFAPWFDMRTFASRNHWVCLEGVRIARDPAALDGGAAPATGVR